VRTAATASAILVRRDPEGPFRCAKPGAAPLSCRSRPRSHESPARARRVPVSRVTYGD
jgi:hypothetical protein